MQDLFGRKCRILTGCDAQPFIYKIINSEFHSNTWSETPLTYNSETNPVIHSHSEDILIVVVDTLVDEHSRLVRVAKKDVELIDDHSTPASPAPTGKWEPEVEPDNRQAEPKDLTEELYHPEYETVSCPHCGCTLTEHTVMANHYCYVCGGKFGRKRRE